jgi:hypothetical protein
MCMCVHRCVQKVVHMRKRHYFRIWFRVFVNRVRKTPGERKRPRHRQTCKREKETETQTDVHDVRKTSREPKTDTHIQIQTP